jgi:hypothetical protein
MAGPDPIPDDYTLGAIAVAPSLEALEEIRIRVLGRRHTPTLAIARWGARDRGAASYRSRPRSPSRPGPLPPARPHGSLYFSRTNGKPTGKTSAPVSLHDQKHYLRQ